MLDGIMLLWFLLTALSLLFVAVDVRTTPASPVLKWGFILLTAYPMNRWLVSRRLKHGMMTVRPPRISIKRRPRRDDASFVRGFGDWTVDCRLWWRLIACSCAGEQTALLAGA